MSCIDCLNNCSEIYSDKCVKYTGPDIPLLGICNGDVLYDVEAIIIAKLLGAIDGTEITLSDVSLNCSFVTTLLNGATPTVSNLVQALLDGECSLKASVTALEGVVSAPFTISAPCLTLGTNPTRDQVLQAISTKLCAIDTNVTTILATYVKEADLCTKVNACITGSSQYNTRMVPFVAYPYHGPLANFNASGIGLSASGFDKVYICNGQTAGTFVTPDYRGRSPIGANLGMPGGALDSSVDPAAIANAGYGISIGTKKGTYTDTLTVPQIPSHTHTLSDPGHNHSYNTFSTNNGGGLPNGFATNHTSAYLAQSTDIKTTGISIASTGSGQPHNTTHPTMGCVFIIYVP